MIKWKYLDMLTYFKGKNLPFKGSVKDEYRNYLMLFYDGRFEHVSESRNRGIKEPTAFYIKNPSRYCYCYDSLIFFSFLIFS